MSGPAVLELPETELVAIAGMTARPGGESGLLLAPAPILVQPFVLDVPRDAVNADSNSIEPTFSSDRGIVRIRPLEPSDAEWLPTSAAIGHTREMLEHLVLAIDAVERSDDQGPFDADEDVPPEAVRLHVSAATERIFGLSWSVGHDVESSRMWRIGDRWTPVAPLASSRWLRALGPAPWSKDAEATSFHVHPQSLRAAIAAFDATDDDRYGLLPQSVAKLFADDIQGRHLSAGDLPRGEAHALADWWIQSGRDADDPVVAFARGSEAPAEWIVNALLARAREDRRVRALTDDGAALSAVAGQLRGTPWMAAAELARAAGPIHASHDPCDSVYCRRFHAGLAALTEEPAPTLFENLERPRTDDERPRRDLAHLFESVTRTRPADTPFSGFLEAPQSIIDVASRWSPPLRQLADELNVMTTALAAYLLAISYPDAGSIDVAAAADREAPEPSPEEYW